MRQTVLTAAACLLSIGFMANAAGAAWVVEAHLTTLHFNTRGPDGVPGTSDDLPPGSLGMSSGYNDGSYEAGGSPTLGAHVLMQSTAVPLSDGIWQYEWKLVNVGSGTFIDYTDEGGGPNFLQAPPLGPFPSLEVDSRIGGPPETRLWGGSWYVDAIAPGGALYYRPTVSPPDCGNGVLDAAEDCDDGNLVSGDCCSPACTFDATGSSCADDGNECTDDICDGLGACIHPALEEGIPCGDPGETECSAPDTCDGVGGCLANDITSGTSCTSDGIECTADICNGAGACRHPALGAGAACGDPTVGDCTAADTCDALGVCQPNDITLGTACTGDGIECTADICNGAGACSHPALDAGTACGDPTATDCTAADTCDGAGACLANNITSGTSCTSDGIECTDDICDDAGACSHPPVAALTACGDPADTECSNPDSCDGAGGCDARDETSGFSCGDTGTQCVAQDTCNGTGSCTDNGFVAALSACGDSADTECANPDSCDGAGVCDPRDEALGFNCGDAGTECTVQDTCNGTGSCTDNGFVAALSACGDPTVTDCTSADTCDGAGACLVNDITSGTACTDDSNDCTNDICDGVGSCSHPALAAGALCGDPTVGDCTTADTCDGAGTCLANDNTIGTACPDDSNDCTVDICDGAGACNHPPLAVLTACGDWTDTECTNPDSCDGAGACDARDETSGFSCGDAGTQCVAQDTCNGTGSCTDNGFVAALTACGDSADTECTNPDSCDGAGGCDARDEASGFSCGDAGTECVVQDTCNGTGTCTDNGFFAAHTACGDPTTTDCTAADTCDTLGVCQPNDVALDTACTDEGIECTADICDGVGACSHPALGTGTACGDPTAGDCTAADACDGAGACLANDDLLGTACTGDGIECTDDICDGAGTCSHPALGAGTACGDPTATGCSAADTCDGIGACVANDAVDGTVCNDNSGATTNDLCTDGVCAGTDLCAGVTCTTLSQCHDVGTCNPATGVCSNPIQPNNTVCSDGNACNGTETCSLGVCQAGTPLNCDDSDACTDDSCSVELGCENTANIAACDDGNTCTVGDVCNAGVCAGALVSGCESVEEMAVADQVVTTDDEGDGPTPADPFETSIMTPNPGLVAIDEVQAAAVVPSGFAALGWVVSITAPPTAPSTPLLIVFQLDSSIIPQGQNENTVEVFRDGTLVPACTGVVGTAAPDPCVSERVALFVDGIGVTGISITVLTSAASDWGFAVAACGDGEVQPGEHCDDGNTVNGDCCSSLCLFETPGKSCPDDGSACTNDICNDIGTCTHTALPAETACGDSTATECTGSDTCDGAGVCLANHAAAGATCGDGASDCVVQDTCDGTGGCTDNGFVYAEIACGDLTATECTAADTCDGAGACLPNHSDNGAPCNDGDVCSENDQCSGGECVGGAALDCSSLDDNCNIGACIDGDVCRSIANPEANGDACDDGNACTVSTVCYDGVCGGGQSVDCDDGKQCTTDACDIDNGCTHTSASGECDDGNACTTADTCSANECVGGPAPNCDDGNICTTDSCGETFGCLNYNNTVACDDGDACTPLDTCINGTCIGSGIFGIDTVKIAFEYKSEVQAATLAVEATFSALELIARPDRSGMTIELVDSTGTTLVSATIPAEQLVDMEGDGTVFTFDDPDEAVAEARGVTKASVVIDFIENYATVTASGEAVTTAGPAAAGPLMLRIRFGDNLRGQCLTAGDLPCHGDANSLECSLGSQQSSECPPGSACDTPTNCSEIVEWLDLVDFEGLPAGVVLSNVFGAGGSGPVAVSAINLGLPPGSSAGVVFDSSCPGGCSGDDYDLGTPHRDFGGPGRGSGGRLGKDFANTLAQGNLAIVADNLEDTNAPVALIFDFAAIAPVTVYDLTVIDTEEAEHAHTATLFDTAGTMLESFELPITGNNGVTVVALGPTENVSKMRIDLYGPAAIDDLRFTVPTCLVE